LSVNCDLAESAVSVWRKRHKRTLTLGIGGRTVRIALGHFGRTEEMAIDDEKPQTRRRFLIAILGGAAATMLVGAPEDAEAAEGERRRRRRRRHEMRNEKREERREERHERHRRRRRRRHKS